MTAIYSRRAKMEAEGIVPGVRKKRLTEGKAPQMKDKTDAAVDFIFEYLVRETKYPTQIEIEHEIKCSHLTSEKALYAAKKLIQQKKLLMKELSRSSQDDSGEPPDLSSMTMSKSRREDIERALKLHMQKLDREFDAKVKEEIDRRLNEFVLPHYNAEHELHKAVVKSRDGVFTHGEYRRLKAALHPDNFLDDVRKERYGELFYLFSAKEEVLCSEKEAPTSDISLPKTAAEMMARRAELLKKRKR